MPYSLSFHRVLKAPPLRVYKAFIDPAAMCKWLPPAGFTGAVQHCDAKVGGTFHMTFTDFNTGHTHGFGGDYLEMKPGERLVYTDKFDDPNLPGVLKVTVVLKKVMCGTDLHVTQEGIPDVIPQEMCNLGWQDSLNQLRQLVELWMPAPEK